MHSLKILLNNTVAKLNRYIKLDLVLGNFVYTYACELYKFSEHKAYLYVSIMYTIE